MLKNLRIAALTNLFGVVVTLGFLAVVLTGALAIRELKVGGPIYHRIVLGKHSGTAAVKLAYERLGIACDDATAQAVLPRVRALATRAKRPPTAEELHAFLEAAT